MARLVWPAWWNGCVGACLKTGPKNDAQTHRSEGIRQRDSRSLETVPCGCEGCEFRRIRLSNGVPDVCACGWPAPPILLKDGKHSCGRCLLCLIDIGAVERSPPRWARRSP